MQQNQTTPLDDLPLPPPTTLTLGGRQVQLVRLALESLLWDTSREEHLAAEIQALLAQLPTAPAAPAAAGPPHGQTPRPAAVESRPAASVRQSPRPAEPLPVADPGLIRPGYAVYAHHVNAKNHADLGQFVGVVQEVLDHHGIHYVHVRGGLEKANELFLPIAAVRAIGGKQVHLNLSLEELAGQAWHRPPSGRAP